jgi:hypothetical protein
MEDKATGSGKGLKSMRKNTQDRVPKETCSNCNCKRYSPCGCMKGTGSTRKERKADNLAAYNLIHSKE